MSTTAYDPETVAHDLFYRVKRSDGRVTYEQARTIGTRGNANVLAGRTQQWADEDEKARKEAKGGAHLTHVVEQVTREQYQAQKRGA